MQFTRPYTKITCIHLEAVDCQVNHMNLHWDLHIKVEPEINRIINTIAAQQNQPSTLQNLLVSQNVNPNQIENVNTFDNQQEQLTQPLTL